jgi:hypothetical protein
MTDNESKRIIEKTVRGILIVLIPSLLLGWGGTYVMVRIALAEHRILINENKEDIEDLKEKDRAIWNWMLDNNFKRGDTIK